jgi:hypothetical protein
MIVQYGMAAQLAYSEMIALYSKSLKISTAENQGSKIVVDGLEERLCGGTMQVGT